MPGPLCALNATKAGIVGTIEVRWLLIAVEVASLGLLSLSSAEAWAAYMSIAAVNVYFMAILVCSALRSDADATAKRDGMPSGAGKRVGFMFPSRFFCMVIVPLFAAAEIMSYAAIYSARGATFEKPITGTGDAVYFSVVTAATVGYGDHAPCPSPVGDPARYWVVSQIVGSMIVFLGIFPLLISRSSVFDDRK